MASQATSPLPPAIADTARRAAIESFFTAIQTGDSEVLHRLLAADAITRWPQSRERITGAASCVLVHANYPGGPPQHHLQRVVGGGADWVAELTADYGDERWFIVSVIRFEGDRIARLTDYFGPSFQPPEWRKGWVEIEDVPTAGGQT
jgi:hypothetical protein